MRHILDKAKKDKIIKLVKDNIKITKEVDTDGITIYSNNYLNKNKFEIKL